MAYIVLSKILIILIGPLSARLGANTHGGPHKGL